MIDYEKTHYPYCRIYQCTVCGKWKNRNHYGKAQVYQGERKEASRNLVCLSCRTRIFSLDLVKHPVCPICGSKNQMLKNAFCQECFNRYSYFILSNSSGKFCITCGKYRETGKGFPKKGFRCSPCSKKYKESERGKYIEANQRVNSLSFRNAVFKRDNYTCQLCGKTSELNAHHLDGYSDNPSKRKSLRNGITLCTECHKAYHSWNGGNRIPATKESFLKFKEEMKYAS